MRKRFEARFWSSFLTKQSTVHFGTRSKQASQKASALETGLFLYKDCNAWNVENVTQPKHCALVAIFEAVIKFWCVNSKTRRIITVSTFCDDLNICICREFTNYQCSRANLLSLKCKANGSKNVFSKVFVPYQLSNVVFSNLNALTHHVDRIKKVGTFKYFDEDVY